MAPLTGDEDQRDEEEERRDNVVPPDKGADEVEDKQVERGTCYPRHAVAHS